MRQKKFAPLLLLALVGSAALHQGKATNPTRDAAQGSSFKVAFTAPARDGVKVGKEMDVKGTGDIPNGNHLWVLSHRIKGFKTLWWPQGEGEIDPRTKEWEVRVTFGEPHDIGYEFEVAAITVDNSEHLKLQEYLANAMTSGKWLPIKMPPLTSDPQYRKVVKENHN